MQRPSEVECDLIDSEMECGEEESECGANILELSGISSTNFTRIARGKIDLNFNIIDQLQEEIENKLEDLRDIRTMFSVNEAEF